MARGVKAWRGVGGLIGVIAILGLFSTRPVPARAEATNPAQASHQAAPGDRLQRLWPPGSAEQRDLTPRCPECWVQEVDATPSRGAPVAAPANPTCYGQPGIDFFRTALAIVAPRIPADVSADLSAAIRALHRPMFEALREGSAVDFRHLLDQPDGEVAYVNCMPLAALLPAGATLETVGLSVWHGQARRHCDPVGGACGGGGRFVQPPRPFSAHGRVGVAAVFMADAGVTTDVARLLVAYRMSRGGRPVPLR